MEKMKQRIKIFTMCMVIFGIFPMLASADVIIFPAQGQTAEQQQKDEADCHQWAVQTTGVDPVRLAQEPVGTSAPQQGGAIGGAAGGALLGAGVGAIAGDTGKGAAIGATLGGVRGASRQASQNQAQQQAYERALQNRQAQMNRYNRAIKACMEGKGYTVE